MCKHKHGIFKTREVKSSNENEKPGSRNIFIAKSENSNKSNEKLVDTENKLKTDIELVVNTSKSEGIKMNTSSMNSNANMISNSNTNIMSNSPDKSLNSKTGTTITMNNKEADKLRHMHLIFDDITLEHSNPNYNVHSSDIDSISHISRTQTLSDNIRIVINNETKNNYEKILD